MRILMVSTDRDIFRRDSEVSQRMKEYSSLVKRLDIIVFTRKSFQKELKIKIIKISDNCYAWPTASLNRWFYILDAVKIGRKIVKNWKLEIERFCQSVLVTTQDPFECGLAGWLIAKKFKIPLQIQIHTDFLSPYFKAGSLLNKIRVLIAGWLISKADCLRVVSQRIKKRIEKKFQGRNLKIVILPIFVDVEKIKNAAVKIDLRQKYPQFNFIILMASRLTKEKNINLAIAAMSGLVAKYPKVGLIIVGEGPEREALKLQITNHKLQNNIILEHWTDDLISYYKTADLFLLTSDYEGYGRTLIEASAAGCNIISTDVGIASEVLDENNIFKTRDIGALKEKIIKAIRGEISPPKPILPERKEEYLKMYKKSWQKCVY